MAPQASDHDILAAITKSSTGMITFDVDKAAALVNVARKTLENRLAGLKREHKINVKATSAIRKSTSRQRKPGSSPSKRLAAEEAIHTKMELGSVSGSDAGIETGGSERSEVSAEL